jgi:Uma2 family endonuclease
MATVSDSLLTADPAYDYQIKYPTSDGRPMGETDVHRQDMFDLIESLKLFYAGQQVYVSGNLLICYRPGSKRKHVAPDVFVVKGIDPHPRDNFILWEEAKGPNIVIEVTSESTKEEDLDDKYVLYRDVIKVPEYFLFDPRGEFLNPPLQGYRLVDGKYVRIEPIDGRLPSVELRLHLEPDGSELRLWNSQTGKWIPTHDEARLLAEQAQREAEQAQREAEQAQEREHAARKREEDARKLEAEARKREEASRLRAEAEVERLTKELETLRRTKSGSK